MKHTRGVLLISTALVPLMSMTTPALGATVTVNTDTTVAAGNTGTAGANGAANAAGSAGSPGLNWTAINVDVIINTLLTIIGGAGGTGGADAANDGGNAGGDGAAALDIGQSAGTVTTNTGDILTGGAGGNGSTGGTGGASDTAGGDGMTGGAGIAVSNTGNQVMLTAATVTGGAGGLGGAAGDAAGDVADLMTGGLGGDGGHGIFLDTATNAILNITGASVISGGDGGDGGVSQANAGADVDGGDGGDGIHDTGTGSSITVGANATVQGGGKGFMGTGASAPGFDGDDGLGIFLGGTGASLTNHGTILGSSTGTAQAVLVNETTTLIDNYGTIGAVAAHAGGGISIGNNKTLTTLRNRAGGLIQSTTNDTVNLSNGSTITNFINAGDIVNSGGGSAVNLSGTLTSFTNSGTIESTGNGLYIDNAGVPDTLTNTGGVISGDSAGIVIAANMGAGGLKIDGGEINNGVGAIAINVTAGQTGVIAVANAAVNNNIVFGQNGQTLEVDNSDLDGSVVFSAGANFLHFTGTGTSTIASGSNLQTAGGSLDMALFDSTVIVNSDLGALNSDISTLDVNVFADLILNENLRATTGGSTGVLVNDGTITIAPGKTLTTDTMTPGAAGTYVFKMGAATNGQLIVNAGAVDLLGQTIEISVDSSSLLLAEGTARKIADGNALAQMTPSDGDVLTDDSALMSFTIYHGNDAAVSGNAGADNTNLWVLTAVDSIEAILDTESENPGIGAVAALLDSIGEDGDNDMDDLRDDILAAATAEEIAAIVETLLPTVDGSNFTVAVDFSSGSMDATDKRMAALAGGTTGFSAGNGVMQAGNASWFEVLTKQIKQDRRGFSDGYDASNFGVVMGIDHPVMDEEAVVGVSLSYGRTDADSRNPNSTNTVVDSYQVSAYGDATVQKEVRVQGQLAYAYHQNETKRYDVGLAQTAFGSYGAHQFSGRVRVGRDYALKNHATVTPYAGLDGTYYNPNSYTETGVGGLGLSVDGKPVHAVHARFGADVGWKLENRDGYDVFPGLHAGYSRDLTREGLQVDSSFSGAPGLGVFRTEGEEPAANTFNFGGGVKVIVDDNWQLRADYDAEIKEDYVAHGGRLRGTYRF